MCQIALSKITRKEEEKKCVIFLWRGCMIFLTTVTTVTAVTTVFLFSHYFWKEQLDTFDNRCDVLGAAFLCVKRLGDFLCQEVTQFFV